MSKWIVCLHPQYGPIYTDMRPEQRFIVVKLSDGWAICDRASEGVDDILYPYPVEGIETRQDAEVCLGKLIRGGHLTLEE